MSTNVQSNKTNSMAINTNYIFTTRSSQRSIEITQKFKKKCVISLLDIFTIQRNCKKNTAGDLELILLYMGKEYTQ